MDGGASGVVVVFVIFVVVVIIIIRLGRFLSFRLHCHNFFLSIVL